MDVQSQFAAQMSSHNIRGSIIRQREHYSFRTLQSAPTSDGNIVRLVGTSTSTESEPERLIASITMIASREDTKFSAVPVITLLDVPDGHRNCSTCDHSNCSTRPRPLASVAASLAKLVESMSACEPYRAYIEARLELIRQIKAGATVSGRVDRQAVLRLAREVCSIGAFEVVLRPDGQPPG